MKRKLLSRSNTTLVNKTPPNGIRYPGPYLWGAMGAMAPGGRFMGHGPGSIFLVMLTSFVSFFSFSYLNFNYGYEILLLFSTDK